MRGSSLALALLGATDAAFTQLEAPATTGAPAAAASSSPYHLLQPSSFAEALGDDLAWASENIPLFESANATLDLVYYFRWRTVCHPDPTPPTPAHPATLSGCGLTPA